MINIIVLIFLMVFACSNTPIRQCKPTLWEMITLPCLERLDDNGDRIKLCPEDKDYPKDAISITIKDYSCERNYQDELILKCKKFQ